MYNDNVHECTISIRYDFTSIRYDLTSFLQGTDCENYNTSSFFSGSELSNKDGCKKDPGCVVNDMCKFTIMDDCSKGTYPLCISNTQASANALPDGNLVDGILFI